MNHLTRKTILIGWRTDEGGDYYPARAKRPLDAIREFRLLFGWSVDIVTIEEI